MGFAVHGDFAAMSWIDYPHIDDAVQWTTQWDAHPDADGHAPVAFAIEFECGEVPSVIATEIVEFYFLPSDCEYR